MLNIFVSQQFTSTQDDLLAGTELETFPGDGIIVVRAASTVTTATLAGQVVGQNTVSQARPIAKDAGPVTHAYDRSWVLRGNAGNRTKVDLGGTTGTVKVDATFIGNEG